MIYRAMSRVELDVVCQWAVQEGWNPGLDDADTLYATDPQGFFVAEDDGELVASLAVVNHSPDFAFLGLYICKPEYRGRGVGYQLWQHALPHAGNRTMGLEGVLDQQDNYGKSGFVFANLTRRYVGRLPPATSAQVRELRESDIPAILQWDERASGYQRAPFLAPWLRGNSTRQTLVFDNGTGPVGAATCRACQEGFRIGPLLAPDMAVTSTLLSAVAAAHPDAELQIDIPQTQTELSRFCEQSGMTVSFETARMYKGTPPDGSPNILALATLELG